jgi:hypothetical protein
MKSQQDLIDAFHHARKRALDEKESDYAMQAARLWTAADAANDLVASLAGQVYTVTATRVPDAVYRTMLGVEPSRFADITSFGTVWTIDGDTAGTCYIVKTWPAGGMVDPGKLIDMYVFRFTQHPRSAELAWRAALAMVSAEATQNEDWR